MSGNGKVVIIGLDGATFRILRPLLDAGAMPTVAEMMRQGASGTLLSTRPPVTCPAWATMFTGVNPGKHGVFSFTWRDPKTHEVRASSSTDVRAPAIWSLMSNAGRRVGMLNVPTTFPAQPIDGVVLTGYVSPDQSPRITWPASLRQELCDAFGDIGLNWNVLGHRPSDARERERHIRQINELMALRNRQFEYLVDRNEFHFCFLVHEYPDRVQHLFYHILDPACESHHSPENRKALELLQEGFRSLDDSLARLMDQLGRDANYLIVSDHGFGAVTRWVYLNNLLEQHGLQTVRQLKSLADVATRQLRVSSSMRQRLGLESGEPWSRQDPMRNPLVDYTRSKAIAGPQLGHAVYVNCRERYPGGIVESGAEYDEVKRRIVEVLSAARDPRTGANVFEGVWPGEALYDGPYVKNAPDVIYELAPGYMVSNAVLPPALLRGEFLRELRPGWDLSGYHRPEGIFIGAGPAFRNVEGLEASILDVAPTVQYLMDLPVPSYMEGQILTQGLNPELLDANPPRRCEVDLSCVPQADTVYSAEEQAEITRRLEDLGYL